MRAVMLYRAKSDHASTVESYMRDFEKQTSKTIEKLDYDSKDGIDFAANRGILAPPSLTIVRDDGSVVRQWVGENLPLYNEVLAYLTALP